MVLFINNGYVISRSCYMDAYFSKFMKCNILEEIGNKLNYKQKQYHQNGGHELTVRITRRKAISVKRNGKRRFPIGGTTNVQPKRTINCDFHYVSVEWDQMFCTSQNIASRHCECMYCAIFPYKVKGLIIHSSI